MHLRSLFDFPFIIRTKKFRRPGNDEIDRGRCDIPAAGLNRLSRHSGRQGQKGEEDTHASRLSRKAPPRKKWLDINDDVIGNLVLDERSTEG